MIKWFLKMAAFLLLVIGMNSQAKGITSIDITGAVIKAGFTHPTSNFLNWMLKGVCIWGESIPYPPFYKISHTLEVSHFLPDVIVSVYKSRKTNAWKENEKLDELLYKIGNKESKSFYHTSLGEGNNDFSPHGNDKFNKFHEIDIVGDPALLVINVNSWLPLLQSTASPLLPYYSSLSDAYMWRSSLESVLYAPYLLPGIRVEGKNLLFSWGHIFPRNGFVPQTGDYKAAVMVALRAADIVTHRSPHFYIQLPNKCGQHCRSWPAHENDWGNVKYQEIYPHVETHAQDRFGTSDMSVIKDYGQEETIKGGDNYVWVLWRHYEGCIQHAGKLLFVIPL